VLPVIQQFTVGTLCMLEQIVSAMLITQSSTSYKYGRHKGGLAPWIIKCDILLFSILVEELFIFTFGIGKMNFHHCLPPCKKSF